MKVSSEKIENCQVSLDIEAEESELGKSLDEAYKRLVNRVSISGFRKGKAPRAVLEQHIGKSALLEEALNHLIPRLYQQAIETQEIEPIAEPQIEVTQSEPLVFKAVVAVKPTVKLGDYHSIKLEPEVVEINDEKIEAAIEMFRERQAVLEPVERPVQPGDFVTISIKASIDGKPFLNHKELVYEVDDNAIFPLPGFAQQLIGSEKDQERIFSLEVPADYAVREFCGKECLFTVTVTEVKEKHLPELNDEFAQACDYENLEAMRKKVESELGVEAERISRLELEWKALEAVVNISEVDYPLILEDSEITSLLRDEVRRLGFQKVEDYLEKAGRTEKEIGQKVRPIARKRVIDTLVLSELAEAEKIEISPAEVDNKVEEIIGKKGDKEDKEKMQRFLTLPQVRESIEESLRSQKTVEQLVKIVSEKQEKKKKKTNKKAPASSSPSKDDRIEAGKIDRQQSKEE